MADEQKGNIPLGGYGKGMSLGLRPRDIPMPYAPHGILRFCPSAMWSRYITSLQVYKLGSASEVKHVFHAAES